MPVVYGSFTKQLKLLPLTLESDGQATVTVRFGYVDQSNVFTASTEQTFRFEAETVSAILDTNSIPGLTRRDDLSFAVYQKLVELGKIDAGTIE